MIFKAENISLSVKAGNKRKLILNAPDIEAADGDIVVIYGPSGAGKTTFLNVSSGVLTPDEGHIYYEDLDIYELPRKKRELNLKKTVGYINQNKTLLPFLTVYDNIVLSGELDDDIDYDYVDEIIDRLRIKKISKQYPQNISGGEYQRAMIARALVRRPCLIIADEPTSNLDEFNRNIIRDIFAYAASQKNIVLVATHDIDFDYIKTKEYNIETPKIR
ncbi:MAG: ATP-binding cassette domain-containing protein [Lachnospiraceae bacterium]|nr:ATP-binding cassette domain-containing protein [Lachnospiraceae bacterium]